MVELVLLPFLHRGRSCAHKAHIPFQDVEELGEFIQAPVPDKVADALLDGSVGKTFAADNPGIVFHFEHTAVLHDILVGQFLFSLLGIGIHAPELIHPELLSILSYPDLGEKDGAGRLYVDERS